MKLYPFDLLFQIVALVLEKLRTLFLIAQSVNIRRGIFRRLRSLKRRHCNMSIELDFNLKPKEAIEYLENKGFKLSFNHNELIKEAHHKAFTVAKVTRVDLLNDIYTSILSSMNDGTSFNKFKKELIPILEKKGWFGRKQIINPVSGEVKEVNIDAYRLRKIYDTNISVANSVGRCKAQRELPLSVYWQYDYRVSITRTNPRDSHKVMNGIIKHKDDSFWSSNYPPNGWGCKCDVRALSKAQMDKKGLKEHKGKLKNVASSDWAYDICEGSKVSKLQTIRIDSSMDEFKNPKGVKVDKLKNKTPSELLYLFFNDFISKDKSNKKDSVKSVKYVDSKDKTKGIKSIYFTDVINDPIIIDDSLFKDREGSYKIKNDNRHLYLYEMTKTLQEPDEIYITPSYSKAKKQYILKKSMLKYYKGEGGGLKAIVGIFTYERDKTLGATLHYVDGTSQVKNHQKGKLIYQKGHSD